MKPQILIILLISSLTQNLASAATLYVPSRDYQTIQDGLDGAVAGDEVVVMPGTYTGTGNAELDFAGKAITLRSTINPENPNWDTIANTIIDCQAGKFNPNRAFHFQNNEGPDSKVIGFTIINGYQRGPIGANGIVPPQPFGSVPPPSPPNYRWPNPDDHEVYGPYANDASAGTGNANGGAIFCEAGSSPTIKHCVISNCTITGAHGGRGADGYDGEWQYIDPDDPCEIIDVSNGQWAGRGGPGFGEGHGGAIACVNHSNPIISNCIIKDNIARGGCGGDGGDGGEGEEDNDFAGAGGDGGRSYGEGKGGGIYADSTSAPTITNCQFMNNIVTTGERSSGGSLGEVGDVPFINIDGVDVYFDDGEVGLIYTSWAAEGGACYYASSGHLNFDDCNFIENKAYVAFQNAPASGEDIAGYIRGSAIYSSSGGDVHLNNCRFTGNLGGAVYCESSCNVDIDGCAFNNNSETTRGGALYIDTGCNVDLLNCSFSGNSAYTDGGALECRSNLVLTNCSFGGNTAQGLAGQFSGYGGAVDVYNTGAILTANVANCSFSGNQATYGGAFFGQSNADFNDCYFIANTAERGGALDTEAGSLYIEGGAINLNNATYQGGGGLCCFSTQAQIRNCTIMDNSADGAEAYGGAIDFTGGASVYTNRVFNCLITGNSADVDGGAIYCDGTEPEIGNCTFSGNSAGGFGGAIFSSFNSDIDITDSIFRNCSTHAIHEEDGGGNATAEFCLFYNNPDGDYYDSGTQQTYAGNGGSLSVHNIPGASDNIYGSPIFEGGYFGSYYLNQTVPSPAVDNGSAAADTLGLDTYTTDPFNVPDSCQVDIGYHYVISTGLDTFQLAVTVSAGNGTIEPDSPQPIDYDPILDVYTYYTGTLVTLIAGPDAGWRVKGWGGTNDDVSTETVNTVVMNADKTVTVEFDQPITITVPGDYSSIQQAFDAAGEGDTILLATGIWRTSMGYNIYDKPVIISGTAPDDPCTVANTIIEMQFPDVGGWVEPAFDFRNVGPEAVLNGITIRGFYMEGDDGLDYTGTRRDGTNGSFVAGGAIRCLGASPTIKNCIIADCNVTGGDGGDGDDGDVEFWNGGHGGWPGYAFGGGLACLPSGGNTSNPEVSNCIFRNLIAVGGNGGNGGNGVRENLPTNPAGKGGRGGGWYYGIGHYWYGEPWPFGPYDFYTRYSGKGGAVYVGPGCTPTFNHCTFTNNRSYSGTSGICGQDNATEGRDEPGIPWAIDNSGGAVYCDTDSLTTFTDCVFNDNRADVALPPGNDDPYIGLGGAVAFEDGASVAFENCTFNGNLAAIGGGVYSGDADATFSDCNFVLNRAYHGAGLYCTNSNVTVENSRITGNMASVLAVNAPNDMNNIEILGQGSGIYCGSSSARIAHCDISDNAADASGGGVYFSGAGTPVLTNCLLTGNTAGRDGGAISTYLNSQLTVSNCTIVGNTATGSGFDAGHGGGLYGSYGTTTNIINSILWGNWANSGLQLGVGTGFEFDPGPSTLNVSYCDVQGMRLTVFVDEDCTLNWGSGNIGIDPCFVTGPLGDYYLSWQDTGEPNQTTDSPCIDAGSDYASRCGLLMYTTRTDEIPDRGIVDMGYHYRSLVVELCRFCDLFYDGIVEMNDLVAFMSVWLNQACSAGNQWCGGADFDYDTDVDFLDYAFFSQCWLVQDISAPVPDPAQWQIRPHLVSVTTNYLIGMTAEDAVDGWGWDVEYYFECVSGDCHDSQWQDDTTYEDTVFIPDTEYGYRLKTRDEIGNETEWSEVAYIITSEEAADITPPTPDPMTWFLVPYAVSSNSISMIATTASDESGVEYYFDCVSGGCHDSGWQDDTIYQDVNLAPDTMYTYRVRARDGSLLQNTTAWSTPEDANTFPAGTIQDTIPPAPPPVIILDPNVPPVTQEYQFGLDWYHRIVATATATDASGAVYYIVECLDDPTLTSGPLQSVAGIINYVVDVDKYGGQYSPEHQWQVFVYDIFGNWAASQIVIVGGVPPL